VTDLYFRGLFSRNQQQYFNAAIYANVQLTPNVFQIKNIESSANNELVNSHKKQKVDSA